MLKKLLAGVITAVLSLGAVVLVAGPASAWRNTISATVTCAADGGYQVTWSVINSEQRTEVITQSSLPGVVPVGTSFDFRETRTFVQTVSEPQNITLTLTGYWQDGDVSNTNSGSIGKDAFPSGCVKVTAEATSAPSVCDGPNRFTVPSYTLTPVTGVQYTVDGAVKGAGGPFPAVNGTTVRIEASVTDPKYELVGTKVWDLTFTEPAGPCTVKVVPVKPILTQAICTGPGTNDKAFYTVTAVTGVLYYVKVNGGAEQPLPAGKYVIPDGTTTVQVIAKGDAKNYYVIDGDPIVYDVETVNPAGLCLKEVLPKNPDPTNAECNADTPGVVPPTTYTLYYFEHVIYQVSINGAPAVDAIITQDTTYPVSPRDATVVVTARVNDPTKYEIKPWSWSNTFVDRGDCKLKATPVPPTATDQVCDKTDPNAPVQKQGTITIPVTAHLTYFLDGAPVAAGVITVAPGLHEVTAAVPLADAGQYKLDPAVVLPLMLDIKPGLCAPDFTVTPAAASSQIGCFSGGSYTLSNNLGDPNAIVWTVNGTQVAPGKYTVSNSGTVTIVAAANAPRYGLSPGAQSTWTVSFKKPTVCDLETLALTGQSPTGLLIAADLLVVTGLALFAVRAMRRRPEMI